MLCSWFRSHPKIIFFKLSVAENSRWKMSINRIMVLNFGLFQFCDFSAVVQRSFLPMKFYQTLEKQKKAKWRMFPYFSLKSDKFIAIYISPAFPLRFIKSGASYQRGTRNMKLYSPIRMEWRWQKGASNKKLFVGRKLFLVRWISA